MKEPIDRRIHRYDDNGELDEDFLGGHTRKAFVRLDDTTPEFKEKKNNYKRPIEKTDKDSMFFGELFRDLMSGKSNYVTYLNQSIVGKKKKDITLPENVSCMIKKMITKDEFFTECVGSRLANLFNVDTVYNQIHYDPKAKENQILYDYVLSVDYIPWGYMTEDLATLGLSVFCDMTPLEEIFCAFELNRNSLANVLKINITDEKWNKFLYDFAKQYLFKIFVCEDDDFAERNVSILYSKDNDFRIAPCFDMECFFRGYKSTIFLQKQAVETIKYLKECMPEVLTEFTRDCQNALKSDKIDEIFDKTIEMDEQLTRFKNYAKDKVKNNIKMFTDLVAKPESIILM